MTSTLTDEQIVAALVRPVVGIDANGWKLHLPSVSAFALVPEVRALLAAERNAGRAEVRARVNAVLTKHQLRQSGNGMDLWRDVLAALAGETPKACDETCDVTEV